MPSKTQTTQPLRVALSIIKLLQRDDDRPEAVEVRMLAYENSTKPLIDYYAGHGLLRTISAEGSPEQIYERTLAILDK